MSSHRRQFALKRYKIGNPKIIDIFVINPYLIDDIKQLKLFTRDIFGTCLHFRNSKKNKNQTCHSLIKFFLKPGG